MDPLMISTSILGITTVVFGAGYIGRGKQIDELIDRCQQFLERYTTQSIELDALRAKEEKRIAHCIAAARKGKQVQAKLNAAERAAREEQSRKAREKTLSGFASTKLRSRAQVVAPVKAKRTRAKKESAAGMAAKTGG